MAQIEFSRKDRIQTKNVTPRRQKTAAKGAAKKSSGVDHSTIYTLQVGEANVIKFKRKDHGFDMGKMIAISPLAIEMEVGKWDAPRKGEVMQVDFPIPGTQRRRAWLMEVADQAQQGNKKTILLLFKAPPKDLFSHLTRVLRKKVKIRNRRIAWRNFVYRLQKAGEWSVKWILIGATSYALSQVGYFMYLHLKDVSWDPENRFKWGGERIEAFHHKQEKESHSYFPEN